MAQNQAHLGDIVGITVGRLKDQQGIIRGLRANSNQCLVRITIDNDPNDFVDYEYGGAELKLIDCYHMGIITRE